MKAHENYLEKIKNIMADIESDYDKSINDAANIIADSIEAGGIIQAYGGGHSYGSALEIVERAGGLIPSKMIKDPSMGLYEKVEGAAYYLTRRLRIEPNDCVVIISNSGRNPFQIDLAIFAKKSGVKLIVVGSREASKNLTSRHSSGKLLIDYADVFIDNHVGLGDASIKLDGLETKIAPTSSIAVATALNLLMINTVQKLITRGVTPPISISGNLDNSEEHNLELGNRYRNRIFNY